MSYVDFTGDETEKEFLEKCRQQWVNTIEDENLSPVTQLIRLGHLFSEMQHRIDELE